MSSAIERFRERQNQAMVLDVPIAPGSTELILKVNRFAESEQNAAREDAEAVLRKVGLLKVDESIGEDHPAWGRYRVEWCEALSKYIERHVKGWTHTPPAGVEPIAFSPGALREVISGMYPSELTELGLSYLQAVGELGKKKAEPTNTESDSPSA